MYCLCELPGEIDVSRRFWGSAVYRALRSFAQNAENHGTPEVFYVNPRHPLLTVAEPATYTHFKYGDELLIRLPTFSENYPGAEFDHADAEGSGAISRFFPSIAEIGEVAFACCGCFIQYLIATVAVDADSRGVEQNLRPFPLWQSSDFSNDLFCDADAALMKLPLILFCPALVDGRAGQVHHDSTASKIDRVRLHPARNARCIASAFSADSRDLESLFHKHPGETAPDKSARSVDHRMFPHGQRIDAIAVSRNKEKGRFSRRLWVSCSVF